MSDLKISAEMNCPKGLIKQDKRYLMDLNFDNIVYSKHDIKRKITIPTKLTPTLAEDLGFHLGDGCMIKYRRKDTGRMRYQFSYTGNSHKDLDYFQYKLVPRKKKLYNLDVEVKNQTTENSIYVSFYCRALYDFFAAIGVPSGKKLNVTIPGIIRKSSRRIKAAFIRGLAAADFSVSVKNRYNGYYPTIKFVSISKALRDDVCRIFGEFCIPFTKYKEFRVDPRFRKPTTTYAVDINGRKRLKLWMQKIGFSDKRNHLSTMKFYGPGEI